MGAVDDTTLTPEQEIRFRRRRFGGLCFRLASHLVFIKLVFLAFTFAFLSLRSAQPVTLAPFEAHYLYFCPKWFSGVDVVASYPASEHVTVHKLFQPPQLSAARTYDIGYNATLYANAFTRTHVRSYHFGADTQLSVEVESDSPVHFMLVDPEYREPRGQHRRGESGEEGRFQGEEGRHWGDREQGRHHGQGKHGDRQDPASREHYRPPYREGDRKEQPHPTPQLPGQRDAHTHHQFRVITRREGKYEFIFWLPKNESGNANIQIRLKPTTTIVDLSGSCPMKSSLNSGHRYIRFRKHQEQYVFLAASPYAPSSSVVLVRLTPRGSKFASTAVVLFGLWIVLRLLARFLYKHAKPSTGTGKCFWSSLLKCRKNTQVAYTPVPVQANDDLEVPVNHRVVFYNPNTIN